MDDPDALLMVRFRDGDHRAFHILYEKYKKKLINFCYRFLGTVPAAEDMAQEVLLRVYRAAPAYRPEARFSTWIFKIATNVCLKELRKKAYHAEMVSLDAPVETGWGAVNRDIEDTATPNPGDSLEEREQEKLLMTAIAHLPPDQRAALLLCTYEGFSYDKIAEQVGKSVSSVKSLIFRARRGLLKALKETCKHR